MTSFTDLEIVSRYRKLYGLSDSVGLEHVERHRKLEAELASKLLCSTPENRLQVFADCYTTLYKELPWLNEGIGHRPPNAKDRAWQLLLKKPSMIYEVGSGKGHLISHLARLGHHCVATEITVERGAKHVRNIDGVEWRGTDGINLARFEQPETYDVVICSQAIEHFHPDDVQSHFENVRTILKPGGQYFFDTPHVGAGPQDLSLVFDLDRSPFMHLREYDFRGLRSIACSAGFKSVEAILCYPSTRLTIGPIRSNLLMQFYCLVDDVFSALKFTHRRERTIRRLLRYAMVPKNMWLVAVT
jgi:SAM-dependent methyltransferase